MQYLYFDEENMRFSIRKGNMYVYSSNDFTETKKVYKLCENVEWNPVELEKIKDATRKHHYKEYGIVRSKDKYLVFRYGGCKQRYYGVYSSYEEADEIIRRIKEEGIDPVKRRGSYRPRGGRLRYIYRRGDVYAIVHDNCTFGTFRRLEDAISERDLLESVDWDWDALDGLEVNWDEEEEDECKEEEVGQSKKTR